MNHQNNRTLLTVILFLASVVAIFPQGSLTPPGAPGATMKSLDQIEPRTPISSLPFPINSPGSYYLTKNLSVSSGNAITIAVSGVTLDLNGFTLSSTTASAAGSGILMFSPLRDITILNGHIRGSVTQSGGTYSGSGFAYGIVFSGASAPGNTLISRVSVSGCLNDGINVGASYSTVVESSTVQTVGGTGIIATAIKGSSALECGGIGIVGNQISDCWGDSVLNDGIYGTVVQNSYGSSAGATALNGQAFYGIFAFSASNCYGAATTGVGLFATTANTCYGTTGGGSSPVINPGLRATNTFNCYGVASGNVGLFASIAVNSYGVCTGGGSAGLTTTIAIGCSGTGSVPISATHQYFCGSGPAVYP
jgi:hypothetical protein